MAKKKELRAQLAEADRRAGAAERKLASVETGEAKARQWMDEQKQKMGLGRNTSFDKAWELAFGAWEREQQHEKPKRPLKLKKMPVVKPRPSHLDLAD